MIRVAIEKPELYIHFKDVDEIGLFHNKMKVYIDGSCYEYNLDEIISFEIRKDKNYNEI